jgi:hypothetical protein
LFTCWCELHLPWPVCVGADRIEPNHLDSPPSQSPPDSSYHTQPRLGCRHSLQMPSHHPAAAVFPTASTRALLLVPPTLVPHALLIAGPPGSCVPSLSLGLARQDGHEQPQHRESSSQCSSRACLQPMFISPSASRAKVDSGGPITSTHALRFTLWSDSTNQLRATRISISPLDHTKKCQRLCFKFGGVASIRFVEATIIRYVSWPT